MKHADKVIIKGLIHSWESKAPYVKSGESQRGVLEVNEAGDKIKCHECGDWVAFIGGKHLQKCALMSAKEYKRKHGLRIKTALMAPPLIAKWKNSHSAAPNPDRMVKARQKLKDNPSLYFRVLSYETRNERSQCHEQLTLRIQSLFRTLGKTPTTRDLKSVGIEPATACFVFNVRGVDALMSLIGLLPNNDKRGKPAYTNAFLIESLRDFFAKWKRLPLSSEYGTLLPSRHAYYGHYKSMLEAYTEAGLVGHYSPSGKCGIGLARDGCL